MQQSRIAAALVVLVVVACRDAPTATAPRLTAGAPRGSLGAAPSYVVLGAGNALPAGFAERVRSLGGGVSTLMGEIGVAVVASADPGFASALARTPGVVGVAEDRLVQWQDPNPRTVEMAGEPGAGVGADAYGDTETFRLAQWAVDAVSAPAAWADGQRGAGARVAILDGGVHSTHVDIAPNLDVAHSTSFVPTVPFNQDVGTFWHGTHVAGIVAAPGQGVGTVGIAPAATLIGVKVLHNGSGTFEWVLSGILYAARPIAAGGAGADIINLSLGADFYLQGAGAAQLVAALNRATMYARQQGSLVVASAGNDAFDLDHTANLISVPAQSAGAVTVAATGPLGFAVAGTNASLDRPASYTNYGRSAINFAAPGGDFAWPGNQVCTVPRLPSGTITTSCWVFDMVIAPCRGPAASTSSYCFAAGTSMAAPVVAGVAALIRGKYGPLSAAGLASRLRASADDLGQPGQDPYYGSGRVNAWRAVQ